MTVSEGRFGLRSGYLSVLAATAGLVAALMTASDAQAATCGTGFDTSNVTITSIGGSSVSTIEATTCAGAFSGNDTTLISDLNGGLFSGLTTDWSLFGKSDDNSGTVTAPEVINGAWSVNFSPDAYSVFAISLKASTSWVVYLFDLRPDADSLFGGGFTTTGLLNNGNQTPALSHMSVAVWDGAVVPIPATGLLLIGGLGCLAALRRRRQKT